ncbi:MAG: hypothetical protein IPG29_08855 [Sphingobacteriales bacterium]|nr:hypothetical protein [Sphingobacteriales bacterium]
MRKLFLLVILLFALRQTTLAQLPIINKIYYNDTSRTIFIFIDPLSDGFQTVTHHSNNTKTKRLYTQRFNLLGNQLSTKLLWQDTLGIGMWQDFVYNEGGIYTDV